MTQKPEKVPEAVKEALRVKFGPARWTEWLKKLEWDSINGCYYLWYAGMYCGIEPDGYIHT